MFNKTETFAAHLTRFTVCLLILLWFYAATTKFLDYPHFVQEMHSQLLPDYLKSLIVYLLPICEVALAILLSLNSKRLIGLWGSLVVFLSFSIYIGFLLFHPLKRTPCPCGGIIEHMGWSLHFAFNLFFLILIGTCIAFTKNERRPREST